MYNPSRGGVRGGADQFSWEGVKNDKHRENYLGHSLMAPVGRWQKGKDLSWYAKERRDNAAPNETDKSELASIKKAEEEAMLIALGHNIVRKTQQLSKEDIREALKRNAGDRDEYDIERVDGVGASSQRVALLSGASKDSKQKTEGVIFEGRRQHRNMVNQSETKDSVGDRRKRSKKKSKKHKKHQKESYDSDSSDNITKYRRKHKESESDSDCRTSSKVRSRKRSKHKHEHYSSDEAKHKHHSYQENKKKHKKKKVSLKRFRHNTSESD